MADRIGIVTGGGDCPGPERGHPRRGQGGRQTRLGDHRLPGRLRGHARAAAVSCTLDYQKLGGLLTRGGTILGTANRGRFSAKIGHGETRRLPQELIDGVKAGMKKLGIRGLVSIGGDGSLSIAQQLFEGGIPVVGVPKTIDNDLDGTVMTFGFDSAVACATDALDRLHTTAESHNRVMVLEVMGRYAGWIAIYAGIAGGADVILIPEIPFTYESICAKIGSARAWASTSRWSSWPKAPANRAASSSPPPTRSPTARPAWAASAPWSAAEIEKRTGKETRACVLGHLQRGGCPTSFDRVLCSIFGAEAVELIADGKFGLMVAYQGDHVGSVKITEAIGRLKTVWPQGSLARDGPRVGNLPWRLGRAWKPPYRFPAFHNGNTWNQEQDDHEAGTHRFSGGGTGGHGRLVRDASGFQYPPPQGRARGRAIPGRRFGLDPVRAVLQREGGGARLWPHGPRGASPGRAQRGLAGGRGAAGGGGGHVVERPGGGRWQPVRHVARPWGMPLQLVRRGQPMLA